MVAPKRKKITKTAPMKAILYVASIILPVNFLALLYITESQTKCEQNGIPIKETCKCVDCHEDEVCGGLWKANHYPGMPLDEEVLAKKVHIVIAHCNKSLDWLPKYTDGFRNIASIHVISKCGVEAKVPSLGQTYVEVLKVENVGRCDHSYAHYITTILPTLTSQKQDDSVVVFLKDSVTDKIHQIDQLMKLDLMSLVRLASSENGFACGLSIVGGPSSAYHDVATLSQYNWELYGKGNRDYGAGDTVEFKSSFANLGDFYKTLNAKPSQEIVQVCYGGVFAASISNIKKQDMNVWKTLEKILERGDNIQEGHYSERSWARLLANPLKPFQIESLRKYATGVQEKIFSMHGPLIRQKHPTEVSFMNLNAYNGNEQKPRMRFIAA
jgi:hypothetical protein